MRIPIVVAVLGLAGCTSADRTTTLAQATSGSGAPPPGAPAPMCVVTDATKTPVSVNLPLQLFPQAPLTIAGMVTWVAGKCPALLPGSNAVADDVTCELATSIKDPKVVSMTALAEATELGHQTQLISGKLTYRDAAGTSLHVDSFGTDPEPNLTIICEITCTGTLDGTLATAGISGEHANNPAGMLPPGFCAELQSRFVANAIDCALVTGSNWLTRTFLADKSKWIKDGPQQTETYTRTPRPGELTLYPTAKTVDAIWVTQSWKFDQSAGDATCAMKVTAQQQADACVASVPKGQTASYTVGGAVCIKPPANGCDGSGSDCTIDAGADPDSGSGTDGGIDASPDAGTGSGSDGGIDASPDAGTGSGSGSGA